MSGSINATRQAAEDDQAMRSQITGKPFRHADSIGRWMTRADNGYSRPGQSFHVPANVQHKGRIVNFTQPLRPQGILTAEHVNSAGCRFGNLIMGQFQRLAQRDVLS